MMSLIQLYVEPFTLRGCPIRGKHLGSLGKLTIYFFPHFAKTNWTFCRNFLRIFFLDARICFGHYGNFMQPDYFGQIIQIERNFTSAQNFGHSGKILMLEKNSDKKISRMLKTFRAVLEFICPKMLGILETLQIFNSIPKNVGHSGKIPMIQKIIIIIRQFGNFKNSS